MSMDLSFSTSDSICSSIFSSIIRRRCDKLYFHGFFSIISPCHGHKNISTSSESDESESLRSLATISISDTRSRVLMERIHHFSILFEVRDSLSLSDMMRVIFQILQISSSTPKRSSRSQISPLKSRYMPTLSSRKPEIFRCDIFLIR